MAFTEYELGTKSTKNSCTSAKCTLFQRTERKMYILFQTEPLRTIVSRRLMWNLQWGHQFGTSSLLYIWESVVHDLVLLDLHLPRLE